MHLPFSSRSIALLSSSVLALTSSVSATQLIESTSLNSCQANSGFTASLFNVVFTPNNGTLSYSVNGISTISGNIIADLQLIAYGYTAFNQTINPCTNNDLISLCPMKPGQLVITSNSQFPQSVISKIPSIAYGVPDLDALVKIIITDAETGKQLACVEAQLSNGQSVDQKAVQWTTAVIAGIGLLASAVTSGLGHSNTAAHVAANALSLFGFFQAQAIIGMTAIQMPPIVESWTQNFQWSMGIIGVNFMQNICTWYQRSTGGSPSTLLSTLGTTSVQLQKRSMQGMDRFARRALSMERNLVPRQGPSATTSSAATATAAAATSTSSVTVLSGIERVGFRAGIEATNIFLTGLIFFVAFVVIVAVCVALFKGFCELAVKAEWLKSDKFGEFRSGWKVVLKGILFRLVLIGYAQMAILCLWELTVRDSAAEVVLALFYFVAMTVALLWAAFKVIRIAKRSVDMHRNPAYILYSDPLSLNKWGFLYVQFRATAYYFVMPLLAYILLKCLFIAFGQGAPTVQAIGLVVIEAAALIGVSILKPWMDRKTNIFNISIQSVNFLNVVFLLVFTNVFNQPGIVTGVMGVVFFGYNAVFALVLLIMVLISSIYAMVSKNPDNRYQPMRDDRGSFIKSQSQLTTELDALGVTARGDMRFPYKSRDLDDDDDSFSTSSLGKEARLDAAGVPLPASASASTRNVDQYAPPHSPIDPSTPFIPGNGASRHAIPNPYSDEPRNPYSNNTYNDSSVFNGRSNNNSPAPRYDQYQPYTRTDSAQSYRPQPQAAPQQQGTPWQRGAGYDH